jgi:hypothetical protein
MTLPLVGPLLDNKNSYYTFVLNIPYTSDVVISWLGIMYVCYIINTQAKIEEATTRIPYSIVT